MLKGACLSKKATGETELDSCQAALTRRLLSNALRLPLLLNPLPGPRGVSRRGCLFSMK